MHNVLTEGLQWYSNPAAAQTEEVSPTRDVFQARLDRMYRSVLSTGGAEGDSALLTAVIGEIGNNCFDHNLGQWWDVPGCWFHYVSDRDVYWIVVADRGQGMLASLRRVDRQIRTHQAALEVAFRKRLSGRAPEQRGNGLKFVRGVINGNDSRGLWCVSGNGRIHFGGTSEQLLAAFSTMRAQQATRGTCTMVCWSIP